MRLLLDRFDLPDGAWWDQDRWRIEKSSSNYGTVAVQGGRGVLHNPGGGSLHAYAKTGKFSDGEVLYSYQRSATTGTNRHQCVLRSSGGMNTGVTGAETSMNGLALVIDTAGTLSVSKRLAGTSTSLQSVSTKVTGTGKWWIRFRVMGGTINARAWQDGNAEPGTWDITQADDGTVPVGVLEFIHYSTSGAPTVSLDDIQVLRPTLVPLPAPLRFTNRDGRIVPFGKVTRSRVDDCLDATQPTWLTGTTTHSATAMTRTLTAAGSSSTSVTLPPVTASEAEAIWFRLEGLRASSDTDVTLRIQLVGATTYELRQTSAEITARLVAGATVEALTYQWRSDSEGVRRKNLTLLMLPRRRQIIALDGDQVIGWCELPTIITEALTPTLTVTATTATGKSLTYGRLRLAVETL